MNMTQDMKTKYGRSNVTGICHLSPFDNKTIRVVRDDELQKWFFSVVDVVEALAGSSNPTDYLKKLRKRNPELAEGWGQLVTPLAADTAGGRQKTNFATKEGIFRIIPFLSSPKEEQFKQWVEEITNSTDGGNFQLSDIENVHGEILLYQPDETVRLEVLMENETVWLTQAQIIELFQSSKSNISEHIANIYEQGELVYGATVRNFRTVQKEGDRMVNRELTYYNLDVIISVGFRVNAKRGIVLIDNYVDDTVLTLLDKRDISVTATIYTQNVSQQLQLDIDRHNAQYAPIDVRHFNRAHDRFLLIDDEVYHIGASLKDLGKKWFAFTLMHDITADELIQKITDTL